MQVKKQELELDMEQQTGFKSRKEYLKAVYCHSAYLTSMQSSVQSLGHVWLFEILWTTAWQASLSITNSQSLLKLMSQSLLKHQVSDAIQPSHPLASPPPLAFKLSQH